MLKPSPSPLSFTDFNMDFAEVGDTTNVDDAGPDGTAHGAVSYEYRMGVNEVSRAMIDDYNSNMGGPSIDMSDMTSFGGNGDDKPATGVSWNEAARFVNWLNTSQGYQAAYLFETPGANDNISLWTSAEAWQLDGENLYRHKDAYYFLPSEDEWYKAAFYDGNTATYYNYATGSDSAPTTTSGGTTSGTAVYRDGVNSNPPGPADITNAGGLSPYGTMAQNGNVWEWGESAFTAPNQTAVESRVRRGGGWFFGSDSLRSSGRGSSDPVSEFSFIGFRVASVSAAVAVVPEPSSVGLLVIGAMGCVLRRKRG
jgi:formylglycine-generating enzyme required for sulfatase activity